MCGGGVKTGLMLAACYIIYTWDTSVLFLGNKAKQNNVCISCFVNEAIRIGRSI